MAEREEFSFNPSDLSIVSTEEIDASENFLNSDPNDIKFVKKPIKKKTEDEDAEEDEEDTETKKVKKNDKKTEKKPIKEIIAPEKKVEEDDFFSMGEDEDEEEEEAEVVTKKPLAKKEKSQEEVKEEDKEEEDTTGGEAKDEEVNVYSSIAEELLNHGIFNLDEDEEAIDIKTPEQLLGRFQDEARKQAASVIDKFLEKFGDDYKNMFENVFVHGVHPKDYLARYTRIEDIGSIDISDEANQEKVVRELLRSEGRSAEYIDKAITKFKNYGDLSDEATEAKRLLVEREAAGIEQAAARRQQETQRRVDIRNEYINNVGQIITEKLKTREFDGIPVDKRFADQIFSYITQERYQTPDKQLLTEFDKDVLDLNRPEKHELKVKLAMIMQMLKEDPTLSKMTKKAISKETGELFKNLKKTTVKTGGNNTKETKKEPEITSWFSQNS